MSDIVLTTSPWYYFVQKPDLSIRILCQIYEQKHEYTICSVYIKLLKPALGVVVREAVKSPLRQITSRHNLPVVSASVDTDNGIQRFHIQSPLTLMKNSSS